ncbi:class I glutamine amidotransferase-like protein [Chytridium lagenaria]|nr:class I glutamine amidotransferase-like protein [Chytridium lagenaria]
MVRIAILKCDVFAPTIHDVAGDYGELFSNLFAKASGFLSPSPNVKTTVFEVIDGHFPQSTDQFDAILITGSKFGVNDGLPWVQALVDYVKSLEEGQVKIIGVCFGHQVVAKAFGGQVESNPKGWEVGWTPMSVTMEGKQFFQAESDTLRFLSMHKDHVSKVPVGFETLLSTEICPVQSIRKGNFVLTIQGHPEFSPALVGEIIRLRKEAKIFTKHFAATVTDILSDNRPLDDVWFAAEMLRFIQS